MTGQCLLIIIGGLLEYTNVKEAWQQLHRYLVLEVASIIPVPIRQQPEQQQTFFYEIFLLFFTCYIHRMSYTSVTH